MPGKLQNWWMGPYIVTKVFPHCAVELEVDVTGHWFKVNGQGVKVYHGGLVGPRQKCELAEPIIEEAQVHELAPIEVQSDCVSRDKGKAPLDEILAIADEPSKNTYDNEPMEETYYTQDVELVDYDNLEDLEEPKVGDAESHAMDSANEANESLYDNVINLQPPLQKPDPGTFVLPITT